jgi:hypothetical protein
MPLACAACSHPSASLRRHTDAMPGQNKPLEIGPDYVVMLRQDESGVEFIDVYLNREFSTPR